MASRSKARSKHRSDRLLALLGEFDRIVVVSHDNPDPDAIASGWALHLLIEQKLAKPVRLVGGGAIVRAENRHLVDLLMPPMELVRSIRIADSTAAVLVDCGLNNTHQLLTRQAILPVAVIDHHETVDRHRLPFRDIRPQTVASATIAASYLIEQDVEPGVKLATALLYAIRTETRGSGTPYSRLDRRMVLWLSERGDPELLAEIENAPLSRCYFGDLVLAMQNTFLYDDAALCLLPRAEGAEIVGEVADLIIRCEGVQRVLCGAVVGKDLLVSVRTKKDSDNATQLVQATLSGIGHGGGHTHRAGGKLPNVVQNRKTVEPLEDELRTRWLAACQVPHRQGGARLIDLEEVVSPA
jgi:nanoRNase/pAp phosphatase (c-di-AMP/oligoRNAs hydrolase)